MATYYDICGVATLLPSAVTGRDDINLLSAECEADLITRYTRRLTRRQRNRWYARAHPHSPHHIGPHGSGGFAGIYGVDYTPWVSPDGTRGVYLRYYEADAADVDASDADEQAFLDAFGLELAGLIRWRANTQDEDGNDKRLVESESRGRRSVSYRAQGRSAYPPGFGKRLRPFEISSPTIAA